MKSHKNPERNYFIDKNFYLSDEIFKNSVGKIFRKNPLYIGLKSDFNPNIGLYPISVYPELTQSYNTENNIK